MRKRITLAVMLGMSIILLSLGIVSYYIIQENIEDSLNKKLALARLIRTNIDNIIKDNVNRLYDISLSGSVNLEDNDLTPEREALNTAYRYSIFTDGIFLLDREGNVILNYPEKIPSTDINLLSIEPIGRMIATGKPVVSNVYVTETAKRKVLFVLVPLKDKNGSPVGIAGGEIDPTNPNLTNMLKHTDIGQNTFIDIIDSNGIVIASSRPSRTLTYCDYNKFFSAIISSKKERVATCHQCHDSEKRKKSTNIVAFVPLEMAPWGVSIQEPRDDVFASSIQLKKAFAALGIIFIGTAFILAIGISRSVVNPIKEVIKATDRIAKGDLSKPVTVQASDEIGVLSQSFEIMRGKLAESIESIRNYNLELENRVRERTRKIKESRQMIQNLLNKIISSEEEERKRIARNLHDETIQDLSALLMKIDMCKLYPEQISANKIDDIRKIVINTLDGLNTIIQNLRPSLLDDLGLEAAIKWLLNIHLGEKGINVFYNIIGADNKRFSPEIEIRLFRIIQEAIANISRHANALNVFVILKADNNYISVDVEDDGDGFDVNTLFQQTVHARKDFRGLGLLGMKERASLMGGSMEIHSAPDCGTRVSLKVPMKAEGEEDV
ncbi:MAG: HAMP domain-containing protein [Nitrospirae bacterium]|nr:HAMP domain-containing protein [Nitrospirota bacterium]MCL5237587.1 HAMP domain-containing protein [Nitrospirota bacterium]